MGKTVAAECRGSHRSRRRRCCVAESALI